MWNKLLHGKILPNSFTLGNLFLPYFLLWKIAQIKPGLECCVMVTTEFSSFVVELTFTCQCCVNLLFVNNFIFWPLSSLGLIRYNMGKLLSKIFGNKEMRILMLGLDAAGKTSIFFINYFI